MDELEELLWRLERFSLSEVNNPNEPAREYLQNLVAEIKAALRAHQEGKQ